MQFETGEATLFFTPQIVMTIKFSSTQMSRVETVHSQKQRRGVVTLEWRRTQRLYRAFLHRRDARPMSSFPVVALITSSAWSPTVQFTLKLGALPGCLASALLMPVEPRSEVSGGKMEEKRWEIKTLKNTEPMSPKHSISPTGLPIFLRPVRKKLEGFRTGKPIPSFYQRFQLRRAGISLSHEDCEVGAPASARAAA